MPYDILTGSWTQTPLMEKLIAEKKSGDELQERKHQDWDDNYTLYRNKIKTNRLTLRQPVNNPLKKKTIKTILSRIDDAPEVNWKELSGDEQKELIYQEIWNDNFRTNKLELIDVLDKKNVLLYGISTKKLNIGKSGINVSVLDVYDIVFDPMMNQWDLESARFIIHKNIFKTVREIIADKRYSDEGKEDLKIWLDSAPGITHGQKSKEEWEKKMERLKSMGVDNGQFALFAGGDRIINLTEHYTKIWNEKTQKFEKRVVVYADNTIELLNETLEDLIGVDFWPFVVWSEDPETEDVYPDSIADLVRTPNKVLNIWFSQMFENRTLKNFQMHWFLPNQNYTPQTYTPGPGVMLPAPPGDDINKVIKPVEVSGLEDTLRAIDSLIQIVERGTGASAIEKGQPTKGEQTLGEIKILVGKTMERTIGIAKFYKLSWYELAVKWDKLMEANKPKFLKLHKISKSGKVYPKKIYIGDWVSEAGYEPTVRSSSEQEVEDTKGIQKFLFVLSQFPQNMVLKRVAQKRMLEMLDLTSEELRQVESEEKNPSTPSAPVPQPMEGGQPSGQPDMMSEIQKKMQILNE